MLIKKYSRLTGISFRGKDTTIAGLKDVIKGMPEVQTKWPSLNNINRIRVLAQGERLTDSTTLSKVSQIIKSTR